MSRFQWTEDRLATLRRLWAEGRSAQFIAERLGGVTRNAVVGKVHRLGLSVRVDKAAAAVLVAKPKPKPAPVILCAVQGCGRKLSKANLAGVCKPHAHVIGACRCPRCRAGDPVRRSAAIPREDVRVALVPYPTSNSGVGGLARVSLPREPWVTA
jgi:GcrA cell cycle regulator